MKIFYHIIQNVIILIHKFTFNHSCPTISRRHIGEEAATQSRWHAIFMRHESRKHRHDYFIVTLHSYWDTRPLLERLIETPVIGPSCVSQTQSRLQAFFVYSSKKLSNYLNHFENNSILESITIFLV